MIFAMGNRGAIILLYSYHNTCRRVDDKSPTANDATTVEAKIDEQLWVVFDSVPRIKKRTVLLLFSTVRKKIIERIDQALSKNE